MKIAVAGKGGVGKTLIAGGIAYSLARAGHTTIAIDADPTPNLARTLGIPAEKAGSILTIAENADLIRGKTGTEFPGVYSLNFTVDDIVARYSFLTPSGVNLLVMGTVKSMDAGCSCAANSVLRALLRHLIVERDEAVILVMEAGLEHIGRGTAAGVDCMALVSDANAKSLDTAGRIARMARDFKMGGIVLIGNRVRNDSDTRVITDFAAGHDISIAGFVPYDPAVTENGIRGDSILDLTDSPALDAIGRIGRSIMKICVAGREDKENQKMRNDA